METCSHLRLIDFVYHSTLGLSVIKKNKTWWGWWRRKTSHSALGFPSGVSTASCRSGSCRHQIVSSFKTPPNFNSVLLVLPPDFSVLLVSHILLLVFVTRKESYNRCMDYKSKYNPVRRVYRRLPMRLLPPPNTSRY